MSIISDLVEIRIEKGIKQSEVAKAMGISQAAVSRFELEQTDPFLHTISLYALAIGARVKFDLESLV